MRYMSGRSLATQIKSGPLSPAEIKQILTQIIPALEKLHSQGIVHRDLKPGNILFNEEGNAYISDFGISKLSEASVALTGSGIYEP